MRGKKKKLRELIFLKNFSIKLRFILVLFVLAIIAIFGYNFLNFVRATVFGYFETFNTVTFKDPIATSAHWQGDGQVYLSKEWVRADGSKSFIDNVSNDGATSTYPLIYLDDKQQPYIFWESSASFQPSEIFFTRGDLTDFEWKKMDGTPGTENISNTLKRSNIDRVAVSSDGKPYIVWQDDTVGADPNPDKNYEILFTHWDGTKWAKMDGTAGYENISQTPGYESKLPRIALDINDNPYVVWDDGLVGGNNEIYFTKWTVDPVVCAPAPACWTNMAGTTAGHENLSNNAGVSSQPRILLDIRQRPYVLWQDNTPGNNDIFFTKWTTNNGWTKMDGVSSGNENISNTAGNSTYDRLYDDNFRLGPDNSPYVVWQDNTSGLSDIYFTHWNGSQWAKMDNTSGYEVISNPALNSSHPQMVINSSNQPQITWISGTALYFSHWDGAQWAKLDNTAGYEIVNPAGSSFPLLTIDPLNNLYISWLNAVGSTSQVFVARATGANWTKMDGTAGFDNISNTPWTNNRPQMVLAPNGNLFVTWQTGITGPDAEIWFAYWDNSLQTWRALREGREQGIEQLGEGHYYAKDIKIITDAVNNPFVVWADYCKAGDNLIGLCLTRWDSGNSRWEDMSGIPGTDKIFESNSNTNAVAIRTAIFDSTKTKPYLVWSNYLDAPNPFNYQYINFTKWTPGAGAITCGGPPDCWTNMAGDTAGLENISNTSNGLAGMVLDSSDRPAIVWAQDNGGQYDIYFTKWTANPVLCAPNPACWTNMAGTAVGSENLSNDAPNSSTPYILLDSSNNPYVIWGGNINLTHWDGAKWATMAGVAGYEQINSSPGGISSSGFKLDSAGNPYFSWFEATNGVLFTHWDGAKWAKMNGTAGYDIVNSTGGTPVMQLDSTDKPFLSWTYRIPVNNMETFFSHWDGAQWAKMDGTAGSENLSNNGGNSSSTHLYLFIDTGGNPIVVWGDNTEARLYPGSGPGEDYFYSRWNGSAWVNMQNEVGYTNISQNRRNASNSSAMAKDSADNLYLAFNKLEMGGAFNLYFTRTGIPINYFRTAQSADVYGGTEDVLDATLVSVNDTTPNLKTFFKYYFSNDNGISWQPAAVGVPVLLSGAPNLEWRVRLMTIDPTFNPTITGGLTPLTISYTTTGTGVPSAPINFSCLALSSDTIRWNFTDTANNETGFSLYGLGGKVLDTSSWLPQPVTDLSYLDENFLTANTLYQNQYAKAFNGVGESPDSNTASCYTLANTPLAPLIGTTTENSIIVKIDPGDNNPANTEYAIEELGSTKYVQANGTRGNSEAWLTSAGWGGASGIAVIGLGSSQTYNFAVKARNGDNIETAFSPSAGGTTLPPGPGPGPINTPPSAPINLTCQALSTDTIRWNFTDTANNETGFRLYGPNGLITDTGNNVVTDISYLDEANLSANTQANNRYVTTFNGQGESTASNTASCYTLANTPLSPGIVSVAQDNIVVKLMPNDGNPPETKYAIKEMISKKYVQSNGTFGDSEAWQTWLDWGGDKGIKVMGGTTTTAQFNISLQSGTTYNFAAKAKNGDGIETALSSGSSGTTTGGGGANTPNVTITATKGVGINLALNSPIKTELIKAAYAYDELILKQTTGQERMILFLEEFLVFLAIVLLLSIIFLILGLHGALKNLNKPEPIINRLKLIWHLLFKDAAFVFSTNAAKDSNGTYQISFNKHKRFHAFSQRNLKRVLGLVIIDLIILSLILININHKSRAQDMPYNQSGQGVNVNDRLSYIVEISNTGTDAATNVGITDILNDDLNYDNKAKIIKNGQGTTSGISASGNNLSFNIGDLGAGQSSEVYFSALVKSGSENETITNQAQVSGDNFATVYTNTTSNLVKTITKPLCGNGIIDAKEQCDALAKPNGCGSSQNCVNCHCQIIPVPAVCGNGIIETGESCDPTAVPIGCGAEQTCLDCQCQPEVVVPPPTPPPTPPTTPPSITPPAPTKTTLLGVIPSVISKIAILQNRQVGETSQNVITPILLILAALNTIPAVLALTITVLPYLHLLFIEPFLWFFRGKRKKWGIVYDALTKLPVALAVVRLYSQENKRLIQTKVTDKEGRYLMIVKEVGKYYLSVTKPDYVFPTRYLRGERQDVKYLDLYHGEEIEVTQKGGAVTANIPLDPSERKMLTEKEAVKSYLLKNVRLMVSYIGMILALLIILIYPTIITVSALVIHIILFLLFRRLIVPPKPKSWGIIYDEKSKQPIGQGIVRIFETRFNKLLETQVTDAKGHYAFLVGKNEYQLLAEKSGYEKKEIKPVDLIKKDQIVNLDLGLKKIS